MIVRRPTHTVDDGIARVQRRPSARRIAVGRHFPIKVAILELTGMFFELRPGVWP